jgi:hypothetical protein
MAKVYIHIQGTEIVSASTNPTIAIDFVSKGKNRSVKIVELYNMKRGKNGLVRRARKMPVVKEINEKIKIKGK